MKIEQPRFCMACGNSTSNVVPEGDDRQRQVCRDCGEIHYINPKIIVGSVCRFDDRILLCRRAIDPRKGFWTIPAGFMEIGETAEDGAAREAMEEANAEIRIDDLIAVYSLPAIGQVQILFRSTLLNPVISPGYESLEVDLVRWDDVPWSELAFPSVEWVLQWAQQIRHEQGPVAPRRLP